MIKLIRYSLLLISFPLYALVPVEGIIMGEAQDELQNDPLKRIFSDIYDKSKLGENKKLKLFQSTFEAGENLVESCSYLGAPRYGTSWQEKQARRSVAATLQYIGLDTSIKAVGAYARKLELSPEEFKRLSKNLLKNYCSQNLTVFSLKSVEKSLEYYYQNPLMDLIPSVESSPFAPERIRKSSETPKARSKEFNHVLKNFRAFCSWGGAPEDYRLLSPYLSNSFIMAFVFKNLKGNQDRIDDKGQRIEVAESPETVQVSCVDLICRKDSLKSFKKKFPLSIGSTGLETDLNKMFCHHFRFQDNPRSKVPQVSSWIKNSELEGPILETSQFISLMTGVPDFFNSVDNFRELPLLVRSSVDEKWNGWAKYVLNTFSRDLMYEESLNVKVSPRRDLASLSLDGFGVHFVITLGEMDKLLKQNDKLTSQFELKLSKNYLRLIKNKWALLENEVKLNEQQEFRDEVARYLDLQLREKEKLFRQKIWNEDFSKLIADELIQQLKRYQGSMFSSYSNEILKVPVKFSFGLFALGYLRYRADVDQGRLKLSL